MVKQFHMLDMCADCFAYEDDGECCGVHCYHHKHGGECVCEENSDEDEDSDED